MVDRLIELRFDGKRLCEFRLGIVAIRPRAGVFADMNSVRHPWAPRREIGRPHRLAGPQFCPIPPLWDGDIRLVADFFQAHVRKAQLLCDRPDWVSPDAVEERLPR
jgi:hypothetical protein